jgi:hypothetical protein
MALATRTATLPDKPYTTPQVSLGRRGPRRFANPCAAGGRHPVDAEGGANRQPANDSVSTCEPAHNRAAGCDPTPVAVTTKPIGPAAESASRSSRFGV